MYIPIAGHTPPTVDVSNIHTLLTVIRVPSTLGLLKQPNDLKTEKQYTELNFQYQLESALNLFKTVKYMKITIKEEKGSI